MDADVNGRVVSTGDFNGDLSCLSQQPVIESANDGNVAHHYTMNDTFRSYSPQNSEFVHVMTEIGTPGQQNVNNVDNTIFSQDFHGSQAFVPNQDYIANLDHELLDLPRDSYISKTS